MPSSTKGNMPQIDELLYQALETELGGEKIYRMALKCVVNPDLKTEWEGYLEETLTHQKVLKHVFEQLKLDTAQQSPGRTIQAHLAKSLLAAMQLALETGDKVSAELVASECVVLAETKDHMNWELIGTVAEKTTNKTVKNVLKQAYDAVATDEAHHLYHTQGWSRELWIKSLGFPAVLPPPEEIKKVETPIGASRAEQQRDSLL